MITASARKRGAVFLLEKSLVSRLPFEVEQPPSIGQNSRSSTSPSPPAKRLKEERAGGVDAGRDEGLAGHLNGYVKTTAATKEIGEMQEAYHREGVEFDAVRGCGWEVGRKSRGSGGSMEGKPSCCAGEGEQASSAATATAVVAAAPTECSGPERALVQLKIDAMFAAPKVRSNAPQNRSGQRPDAGAPEGIERAETTTKADLAMDVDGGIGVDAGEGGGGPACYACRGGLGTEGGDVLCSFCDRAACQGCWQKCFACEVPHCSLCLAADYSLQFECYFCPPCYQDRRLESCS